MGAFFVKLNGTVLTAEQLADVTWSSDNTEIASVGEDGIIKPGAEAGTATITAEYEGLTATGTVKVNEAVAEIDGVGYTTVSAALTAVKGTVGKTVKILKDQSLAGIFNRFTLDGSYDFTLDLNEKTLDMNGAYFTLNGAKMTVTNGTINVKGNMTQLFTVNSGELTIGETAVINGTGNVSPVAVFGPATVNTAGTLTAENTFAIAGNGTAGKGGYTINITRGKISSGNAPAVYHPNEGTVNISGGTITGATAVYQKSGTLNITGGTLAGKGNQKDYTYNGNGANATGDALVVDNCGYPGGAPETAITGGVFISDNASAVGSYAYGEGNEAEAGFIEGGVFSDDSDTTNVAVPEDKILVQIPEGKENAGLYELAEAVTVTFDAANGTEQTEQKIVKGTAVEEPEAPAKEGYYLLGWFAENSETAYYFDTEVAENLTLTAKWVRIVEIPTAASGLIYTRSELTGVAATDDYNVEEGAKTDAGDYIATVTLKDAENTIWSDFTTEAKTIDWKIEPKDISNAVLEAVGTQNYTGSEITPELTVTLEEPYGKLDPATDFTPGYSENTAVGIASYWAEGKGNYTGKTDEKNFSITGTSISKATITLKQDDAAVTDETYTYDGNAKEPTVVVTMTINGKEVTLGEDDFTATFYNNVNAGEAAVFVVGEGSFAGGQVVEFKINPAKVAKPTASDKSYTGEEQKGIEEGEHYTLIGDYKATDVGTYTAIASLSDSNYAWADGSTAAVSLTWKITEANAVFEIEDIADQTYTGKAITPEVKVTATPEEATYEVTYSNNVEIGEATVTVTGTGSYTGTATKTFNIVAGEPKVAKIGDVTYPSLAAAVEAAADGDTVEMSADEELDAQVTVDKNVTIDLAGHKLYNDNSDPDIWNDAEGVKAWSLISVQGANVVITGDGTLQAKVNDSYAADVRDGGSLMIENGTLIGNISAVYVLEGALTVNGGDFSVQQKANGSEPDRFLINLYDANRTAGTAAATITGGTFHGFDPSDNLAEGAETDFTPAGMTGTLVEGQTDIWTVVKQTVVEIPEGSSYVYDGTEKTGVEESEGYTLDGTTKAAEVGEYTATVALSDLYIWADGTEEAKEITWTITPADLSSFTVDAIAAQTYTGKAITPAVTVKNGETTLTADTDYTVAYENNTETGIAKATITGTGSYSGTIVTYFAINEADSSDVELAIAPETCEYDGTAKKPVVTVTDKKGTETADDDAVLTEGKDYDLTIYNNTDAGTATVIAILKGNYEGAVTGTFTITPVKVTAPEAKDYTYDGTEKTGVAAGENYTLTGTVKATDKGAYTVTAALNSSNYVWDDETTAPKELSWKISEKALEITIGEIADQTYTGSPVEPELTITGIPKGVSYETVYTNNVEAGTAKVTVTVTDPNYSGSATAEFKITGAPAEDLSSFTVEPIAAQTYTGSPITPAVTVKDGDKTLTAGTDYTAEYKNNTETGVATVTITGKGDYTGTIAAYFAINEKDAEDLTISDIPAQGYTGSQLKPAVLIKDTRGTAGTGDDITLTEGLDYNLHYINNVNEGTATVIAILKGNYEGSLTTTFEITKPKATFTIGDIADQTYTGSAIEPEVTVTAEPADVTYEVTYSNNTQTGTATVTVTATGKYSGSAQKTFKIVPAAHVHKLTKHAAKAATCTAAGNSAYWSCSDCGKYFSDEAGTKEIAADSWVIPAKGHKLTKVAAKAATCTKDGTGAYYRCSVCGKMFSDAAGKKAITAAPVVKATGHSWGSPAWTWNKDHTKATAKFTCTKCKETKTVNASIKKTTTAAKPGVAGKTEYVATATLNGKTYTDKKTVTIPALPAVVKVTGISVSPKTKTLSDHDTVTLKATVTPSNAANKKVTWKSSNTKVATVDANGKVTTKAAGTAVITATAADGSGKSASCTITAKKPSVSYRTHVQTYGWQNYVKDGAMSGTQGEAKRLEGINIKLENAPYSGSIVYRTHVQTYGWQNWKKDNQMSGTEGEAKRLEGIQIYLTGEMAKHYDVYYRVHAQTYGWLDWAKNGVMAGTSGLKKRLEGINIVLVPKGGASPGGTSRSSVCGNGTTLPPNPYKEP